MNQALDYLQTGNNNADLTFGNEEVAETTQEAIAEQQAAIQELMPNVQLLRDYVDNEIEAVSKLDAYIKELGKSAKATDIQAEYRARVLYIEFLRRFRGDIDNQVALAESEAQR